MFEAAFRALGHEPPVPSLETGDLAILRQMTNSSDMLAVTSPHQMMFELRSGLLTELEVDLGDTTREIVLILRDGAMFSPAMLALLDAFRTQAHEYQNTCAV
jgi:LysR family transcriptional regulator of gallate degradation